MRPGGVRFDRRRGLWLMLLVLSTGFMLSQAFRTSAAILAAPLALQFQLSPDDLGLFAGTFHLAFGALQLLMGIGIDLHGPRRVLLTVFPLSVIGSVVCAAAGSFEQLLLGQALIGVGCAPAFLVCTVFIARHFAADRFAAVSGAILGLGGIGMLLTGTPMAWLIDLSSWRAGFWALAAAAAVAWLAIAALVHEPAPPADASVPPRESLAEAWRGVLQILRMRHTLGIVLMALVTYASFITLRGLWLSPMLIERHGWSLVASGHVALLMSVLSLLAAPLFGRLDPGPLRRRRWIVSGAVATALMFLLMAFVRDAVLDVALTLAIGLVSAYMVLQYPDVKSAYAPALTGRAMSIFTMALFLGIALMQGVSGIAAAAAHVQGIESYAAAFLCIGLMVLAGTAAFVSLPGPPGSRSGSSRG